MKRSLWLVAAALAAVAVARDATAEEVLKRLEKCPPTHRACLSVELFTYNEEFAQTAVKEEPSSWDKQYNTRVVRAVTVRGALAGAAPSTYRLTFKKELSELDGETEIGPAAYLGRSPENRPIILTNRGELEIYDGIVDIAVNPSLATMREKEGKLLGKYMAIYGASFVVTKSGEVGAWDDKRKICLTAPRRVPGMVVIITTACRTAGIPTKDSTERVSGNVVSAPDIDIAHVEAIIFAPDGGGAAGTWAYRASGTGLLVITLSYDWCC
jgi:hypothetical protein